jgi:hypothetical protein
MRNNMKVRKKIENIIQPDKEGLVEDSLIGDYIRYVDYLERHGWTRECITITELLSVITTISKLKAGNDGIVLDVRCPAGLIMSVPGIEGVPNEHDVENIRPIEVKFANPNGKEIDPDTCIEIFKHKLLKEDVQIGQVLYRDISMVDYSDSPNLFKDYVSLYRFKKGIEIKGEDSLRLHIINPDVDVEVVKFNFGADLWTRTE